MHGIVQSGPFACRRGRWNVCGCKDFLRYIRLQGGSEIALVISIDPEKARVQLGLDVYSLILGYLGEPIRLTVPPHQILGGGYLTEP